MKNITKVFLTALMIASTLFSYGQNLEKFEATNGKQSDKEVIPVVYDNIGQTAIV